MEAPNLLLGWTADDITAFSTAGLLVVTLIFSAIGAIFHHRAQNPEPTLEVNFGSNGKYEISVTNPSSRYIQISSFWIESGGNMAFSKDGNTFTKGIPPLHSIPPHQTLALESVDVVIAERITDFEVGINWHHHGTATKTNRASVHVRARPH